MSDYSTYSMTDLEKLKEDLLSQRYNLDNTIDSISKAIVDKRISLGDTALKTNPYYKDRASVIKVTVNESDYTITKLLLYGSVVGVDVFNSRDTSFLKYFKMCSEQDWLRAIDTLNKWLVGVQINNV